MKKALVMLTLLTFTAATSVFSASFAPEPLKISAPASIQYAFDGSDLNIPVSVSGSQAAVVFCVYTKNQAETINKVQNGFLGWHYVNKIDTSVYIAPIAQLNTGNNTIGWTGRDDDGKLVPAGDYTYYLWGYDNVGQKLMVNNSMTLGGGGSFQIKIQETGQDGSPLANPIIYGSGGRVKWVIGADPADSTLLETTAYDLGAGFDSAPDVAFQPGDFSRYFIRVGSNDAQTQGIRKMIWVPNGTSTFDTAWGDNGIAAWSGPRMGNIQGGPEILGDTIYATDNWYQINTPGSNFYSIGLEDGVVMNTRDMTNWWVRPQEAEKGGKLNSGPGGVMARGGYLFLNSHSSCIKQMVNPLAENEEDFVVWTNQNGDYVLDYNFETDSTQPWFCNGFVSPYTYHLAADANLFSITSAYDMGAVSFGLLAPDGDGIGYLSYAGDTASWKIYNTFVDSNSAFDGIYCDNQSTSPAAPNSGVRVKGVYYIGHDSIKGTIGARVAAVKESSPAAFSIAQNSPNPFNPNTTISFTLAKAGKTSVEVYNVAGQKVDTLVNGVMSAGSHSVVWNAAKFSAGVYFYTVKSGSLSKTMKMTLLK